jgi:hypothetical protein
MRRGVGEVLVQLQICGDLLMQRELFTVVCGQGVSQPGEGFELLDDDVAHARSVFSCHAL